MVDIERPLTRSCVLYEMCEHTHAFNASNLLGLVWKIVKDEAPRLSDAYSPELALLVRCAYVRAL